MSLNSEQLKQHCQAILNSRRILNKLVILCEGDVPRLQGRPSPQSYGRMESMPDANFYKACVPNWWREKRPQFFNCGDRVDVINTYFSLLEQHQSDSYSSYLDPAKLFAIVDLDIQPRSIPNYHFSDTEAIFNHLYSQTKVDESNASQHQIWVTGLVHKEAYFLLPQLQEVFDRHPVQAIYKSNNLVLENIYINIADDSNHDSDLLSFFQKACDRICHCTGLDLTEINQFKNSWITEFQKSHDQARKEELIFVLLTIRKAKSYWNQIEPSSDWTRSISAFQDQLMLEIGRFYSEQSDTARYHIPAFFRNLYSFA